jgi:ATP-binding cassette subfamily F protein 3
MLVSHDRYILNALAGEVLEVGQGHAIHYLGNYDEYLAKKEQVAATAATAAALSSKATVQPQRAEVSKNGAAPKANADRTAQRKREQNARRRAEVEETIEKKEAERAQLATEMNNPNFYLTRKDADQLIARYETLGREVDRLYSDLVKYDTGGAEEIKASR